MKKLPYILSVLLIFYCTNCLNAEIIKILIQGDTQKIMDSANGEQDNFVPLMAKILTDPVTRDADFIFQMGDIVESDQDNSDRPQQYAIARKGWQQLDGKIPYVLNLGNNDNAEEYFAVFDDLPEPFAEASERRNFVYSFSSGNIDWLIISMRFWGSNLEKAVKDEELEWAKEIIEENVDKKVILIKHEINLDSAAVNKLKAHPNLVFILSGHTDSEHAILTGNEGNQIAWIRTCHHNAHLDSYFRVLLIDTVRGTVSSRFYSPQYEKFWHDPTAPYHECVKSAPWVYEGFDFGIPETTVAKIPKKDAGFVSLDIPCCVIAGSEFNATARVLNTGKETWTLNSKKSKYKLGSVNPEDNLDWGADTDQTGVLEDVLPGAYHTFEINCKAPSEVGYYNFRRRMIKGEKKWFGEYSENRIVYVCSNKVASYSFEKDGKRSTVWVLGDGAKWSDLEQKAGSSSLRLSGSSKATKQVLHLEKNTEYSLSFWVKRTNKEDLSNEEKASDNVFVDIYDPESGKSRLQIKVAHKRANGEWAQFSGKFNSESSDSLNLRFYGTTLKSTAHFDEVVLTPATPYGSDFVSAPTWTAYKDIEFSYELDVTDFDKESLIYHFDGMPGWLSFDDKSATLSGTPDDKDVGVHSLTFRVQDEEKEDTFTLAIKVLEESPILYWNEFHTIDAAIPDGDRDGLVNFLEFALGGDPNQNDSTDKLPKFLRDNSGFNFNFRRNQSALTYTVQTSTDLINWSDYMVVDDSHGLVGDTCTINIPISEEKKFFKLEVSQ